MAEPIVFPEIQKPESINREKGRPMSSQESPTGRLFRRPIGTKTIQSFELIWKALNNADFITLETFFDARQSDGESFVWEYPTDSFTVEGEFVFIDDTISGSRQANHRDLWAVTVKLQGV